MERFVFVAAIFVAVLFAMGAMFGHGGGWHFEFDEAHGRPAPLVEVAPGQMAAQTYAAAPIRIRHAAARGWVDRIIEPHKTREELIAALEAANQGWDYSREFRTGVLQT